MENKNFVCSITWLAEKIAEFSNNRYFVSAKRKDYPEIIKSNDWKAICFHFEIRPVGYHNGNILSANTVKVVAHYHFDKTKPAQQKVIEYIGYTNKASNTCTKAQTESITVNFSDESSAEKSVKHIIEVFDSFKFQQSAIQADECLKKLKSEGLL